MVKKNRIGLLYSYDENWVGGTYYVQNLIRSLNVLPFNDQPVLYVVTKNKKIFNELKEITNYSKLIFVSDSLNAFQLLTNKITKKVFKVVFFHKKINLEVILPLHCIPKSLVKIPNILFWIPDLQEKFLPHFFSVKEIQLRHERYQKMIQYQHPIVFSSHVAKNDFETFFPNSQNKKIVLQFSVIHPKINFSDINFVKEKYNIEGDYFFSPNQFWQHKNHVAVIEATKILKDKGLKANVIFTGKEFDYRNPDYSNNLKEKTKKYGLEDNIRFLGFIDRNDQLLLMKFALGVIQPSLFEGWSTAVEDAKALNQKIIVSDILVHREQLEDQASYFLPNDYIKLAKIMELTINNENKKEYKSDYNTNILNFALNLKSIMEKSN